MPHSQRDQLKNDLLQEALRLEQKEKDIALKSGHWDGSERRSIPIHILNYLDERLGTHAEQIENIFVTHTKDEMERYKSIEDSIETHAIESQKRHAEIMEVISHFNGKCRDVHSAFLLRKDGSPDFEGHAKAHESWLTRATWRHTFKNNLFNKVGEVLAIAATLWVLHVIWEAFLKGPLK